MIVEGIGFHLVFSLRRIGGIVLAFVTNQARGVAYLGVVSNASGFRPRDGIDLDRLRKSDEASADLAFGFMIHRLLSKWARDCRAAISSQPSCDDMIQQTVQGAMNHKCLLHRATKLST